MNDRLQAPTVAAPTDWRGLCWAIDSLLDGVKQHDLPGLLGLSEEECDRIWCIYQSARAALAQPEPKVVGPTDQELADAFAEGCRDGSKAGEPPFLGGARAVLARWGRHAPVADDRGVLPMIVSETGADDEPELERIICASISGGADYVNNMPRELSLERITPDGSTFARYTQADTDTRFGGRPVPAPAEGEVAELVTLLAVGADCSGGARLSPDQCHRAADLLEQRQSAPVSVSERPWEREGWCDEQGRCWWFDPEDTGWVFDDAATCRHWADFSLPNNALPLPACTKSGDSNE